MVNNEEDEYKTDEELVVLINNGNVFAFEMLYDRYSASLFQFFYAKLRDREKAEDFLQELFLKLFRKGESFDTSKKFSSWIYSIAHNQCKNEYRKLSRTYKQIDNFELNDLVSNVGMSSEKIDESIFSEHLRIALNTLSHEHQSSFILRFKYELSIREISEILDCSEGTTKSRIFYSLKKLAKKLKHFNPYVQ